MSSKRHRCDLYLGSDSMLPTSDTRWGNIWRNIRKLSQISMVHPETPYFFRSYSAVVAERQRLLLEKGYQVIHPLSVFSIIWTMFMIPVNFGHLAISPFRLFYILHPIDQQTVQKEDNILLFFHILCLLDVVMKFNMGYVSRKNRTIFVDRKSIAWQYIRTWFILDLVSSSPLALILLSTGITNTRYLLLAHILPLLKIARICNLVHNMIPVIELFSGSYIIRGLIQIPLLVLLSAHWSACLMYLPAVVIYYWTGEIPLRYNYYLHALSRGNLLQQDLTIRYTKAFVIVVSAFLGTGFSMFHSNLPEELLIHSFIIAFAAFFIVFTLAFLMKCYLAMYDSTIRYNGLINQVEEYMEYRQFPISLKRRVIAFYQYKYRYEYFKEVDDLQCLSEELRDEIRLNTCRMLIEKVKLFEDLPAEVVGTVLGCLHPEIYLANDLVVACGEIGDCMYFIANGTVAVYSTKGVEICHLEDGAHFGEVALLVKDSKRSVTIVAVETTQVYRLDGDDFRRFISTHPMLIRRIEALASRRMHDTVIVDEVFRQERERQSSASASKFEVEQTVINNY